MLSARIDSLLARFAARRHGGPAAAGTPTRSVQTPVGTVRVYDSGAGTSCVVFVPDGPNVIEHYDRLIELLAPSVRVVCFDMPGFGYSFPQPSYGHSLEQGAKAVLGVLDGLDIQTATLAFSCANGFYALRAARMAPERISSLVLSQTPSLPAMHAWTDRNVPRAIRIPVAGQIAAWAFRRRAAQGWYRAALPRDRSAMPFQAKALNALSNGSCFCLAGVVQGLCREQEASLDGVKTPLTIIWGDKDRSHRETDPLSLRKSLPHAEVVRFHDCGHFPDIEQPERYAAVLLGKIRAGQDDAARG